MRLSEHAGSDTPLDDAALLERARRGERAAQGELLDAHYNFIRGFLFRLVGPDNELDDLQQTVLVRVITSLPSFRGESSLASWIRGICVHVARDHFRRKKTRRVVESSEDIERQAAHLLPSGPGPNAAEGREDVRAVHRALAHLSPNHRTVLVLRLCYGHSIDEIAMMTQSAKSTTRLRLYYARKAFVRALENEGGR